MNNQNNIRALLRGNTKIPVVSFNEQDNPVDFANYLLNQGINCIEVTLRSAAGLKAIEKLKCDPIAEKMLIGAGTVVSSRQIKKLKDLGTDFLVSPGITSNLKRTMEESGIPYLPGVCTPGEMMKAREMDLFSLKFFPAELFGGPKALKTYASVFPDLNFCPTGGITEESSKNYLDLPNVFAVGGSWFQNNYKNISL